MRTRTDSRSVGVAGCRRWGTIVAVLACVVAMTTAGAVATAAGSDGAGIDRATRSGGATFAGSVAPARANTTIRGTDNGSLGKSIAAGDVNGDGRVDLLVGAPFNGSAGPRAGAAYLFFGPVAAGEANASGADAVLLGASAGDWAGWSVAAGDLNDDGYDDVVVGAPLSDRGGRGAGAAYVVYGHAGLTGTVELSAADDVVVGEARRDNAGKAVAVGDVAGDAAVELVVGAPRHDAGGNDSGAAYVVAGDALPTTGSLAAAETRLAGASAGDRAGSAVAPAGDFDGDGAPDLVVGARNAGATKAGAAYVVTRSHASGTVALADATLRLRGVAPRDHAGWAVAGAGDTNADGYDDVVVGAPTNDDAGHGAGAAYVVRGGPSHNGTANLSDADLTLLGAAPGDRAGWSVGATGTGGAAGSGDVACDGVADVLVGAPHNDSAAPDDGAVSLIAAGSSSPTTRDLADADARFAGDAAGAMAGWAVAAGADVNGDGTEDVVVGAPGSGDAGHHAGAVYVHGGGCPVDGSLGDGGSASDGSVDGAADDDDDPSTDGTGSRVGIERVTACASPELDAAVLEHRFDVEPTASTGEGAPTAVEWGFWTANPDRDAASSVVVERTDGTLEVFPGGHAGIATAGGGAAAPNRSVATPCALSGPTPADDGSDSVTFVWNEGGFERVPSPDPPATADATTASASASSATAASATASPPAATRAAGTTTSPPSTGSGGEGSKRSATVSGGGDTGSSTGGDAPVDPLVAVPLVAGIATGVGLLFRRLR